jgi:hypothetical protein
MKATKRQVIAINAAISYKGLKDQKKMMMLDASNGRTESSKELTFDEAGALLQFLNSDSLKAPSATDKQVRKLIALAYDIKWIKERQVVGAGGKLESRKDYSALHEWVKKFGYLGKELREYNDKELPKLLTQFQHGPHAYYLKKNQ